MLNKINYLPNIFFGDVRANYTFSKLSLIKSLSPGRQNKKLKSLPTNVKKMNFVKTVKFLYAEGILI